MIRSKGRDQGNRSSVEPPPGRATRLAERFRRDGIAFPVRVLDDAEVKGFSRCLEPLERALGPDAKRILVPHLRFRWAYDLASHPAVLDAVEALLGPELVVLSALVLTKPPHDPAFVTWHQDGTYTSGMHETPNASAWIALRDSTPANGCLRVVPGSHRQMLPHKVSEAENNLLLRGPEIAVEIDEDRAVDVRLAAGEMSLHHSRIVHGSNPNRSATTRTGFIVRFATPAVAANDHPVIHARGTADCCHLPALDRPPEDDFDTALSSWRAYVRRHLERAAARRDRS